MTDLSALSAPAKIRYWICMALFVIFIFPLLAVSVLISSSASLMERMTVRACEAFDRWVGYEREAGT